MQDRRQAHESPELSQDLIKRGRAQLEREIRLIRQWLSELDETRKDNPESLAARKAYGDMLQTREDLLTALPRPRLQL